MKIGFVAEAYPPMSGGVATSVQRISRQMVKLGHQVVVLTYDNLSDIVVDDFCLEEQDCGVHIYRVGPFFLKNKHVEDAVLTDKYRSVLRRRAFSQMRSILEREKVDIILTFYLLNSGFMGQMLANELELPCVAGIRGNDIGRNIFNESRFAMLKWTLDEATYIISVNEHLKKRATIAFRDIKNKIAVIHNGFNFETAVLKPVEAEFKAKLGWRNDDLIVTFIGLLREKKGVSALLKAIQKVNETGIHVRLLVVGPGLSGAEKYMLGDVWDELVANNIIYSTGLIPREEVLGYAKQGDVICLPSLDDGMPNGLIEGMSQGLCPITTNILTDIFDDGTHGMIVEPGNVEELVSAFECLYQDRALVKTYGEKSKARIAETFTPEREAKAYIALFETILEEKHDTTL